MVIYTTIFHGEDFIDPRENFTSLINLDGLHTVYAVGLACKTHSRYTARYRLDGWAEFDIQPYSYGWGFKVSVSFILAAVGHVASTVAGG